MQLPQSIYRECFISPVKYFLLILWHLLEYSQAGFSDNQWCSLYALNSFIWPSHVTFSHCMYIFVCMYKFHQFTFSINYFREDVWLIFNNTQPVLEAQHVCRLLLNRTDQTATLAHHTCFTQDRQAARVVWVGSVYIWGTGLDDAAC